MASSILVNDLKGLLKNTLSKSVLSSTILLPETTANPRRFGICEVLR
jgi:hypothetical protein